MSLSAVKNIKDWLGVLTRSRSPWSIRVGVVTFFTYQRDETLRHSSGFIQWAPPM